MSNDVLGLFPCIHSMSLQSEIKPSFLYLILSSENVINTPSVSKKVQEREEVITGPHKITSSSALPSPRSTVLTAFCKGSVFQSFYLFLCRPYLIVPSLFLTFKANTGYRSLARFWLKPRTVGG